MNQVFFTRLLLAVFGLGMVFVLGRAFLLAPDVALEERKVDASVTERRLVAELEALRAAWDARQRRRILELAPEFAARYRGALNRILRIDGHPLLPQAAEYAGATGLIELREPLVRLVHSRMSLPPDARIQVMRAAERLDPWNEEQLSEFLSKGTVAVRLGALHICAERKADVPWHDVLAILNTTADGVGDSGSKELSEAAIRAIPNEPDPHLRRELWNMVSFGEGAVALVGLRALARTTFDSGLLEKVLFHMDQFDESAMLAALDLLGRWGRRLPDPKPVWAVAARDNYSMPVRAMAFYCLERTRSFDVRELRELVAVAPPLLQYFACRCIMSTGHADGAQGLLGNVDGEEGPARLLSRQLLGWMTGKSATQDRAGFEEGLVRGVASMRGRRLPPPDYDFGLRAVENVATAGPTK